MSHDEDAFLTSKMLELPATSTGDVGARRRRLLAEADRLIALQSQRNALLRSLAELECLIEQMRSAVLNPIEFDALWHLFMRKSTEAYACYQELCQGLGYTSLARN
jgi:hypothetical protein